MSSKGNNTSNTSSSQDNISSQGSSETSSSEHEPTIISGWEHSTYAHRDTERFAYIGKDDDGEPEWVDYGKKSSR
ncbi:hypothetical protein HDU98_006178 [Podochytrium sp. JEL0797]|nr:hypothetical protein HDU98_006178 [Podochytrium sp. JEL0797]